VVHLKNFEPFHIISKGEKNDDHEDYHDELTHHPPPPMPTRHKKGI
jgi:hypothetical protein